MEKTIRIGRRPFDAEITYESAGPNTDRAMRIFLWMALTGYVAIIVLTVIIIVSVLLKVMP